MTDLGEYGCGEQPAYEPPVRPRRRVTRVRVVAIPLVLLLVEGVVLGERIQARLGRDADPVRVATAFLTALENDDAAAAAALTRLPAGVDTRFTLADLRAEGEIERAMVTGSRRHDYRTTVTVAYTAAGVAATSLSS